MLRFARHEPAAADLVEAARREIAQLERRSSLLPQLLNEDPQWMMVLDLFIAAETDSTLYVLDVCASSRVPQTTALRHIQWLEEKRVIVRSRDPFDGRKSCLKLSDAARQQVAEYLLSTLQ